MQQLLVQNLAENLLARKWKLALAESCTGGMIAAACTDLPGSSHWFDRGFVTYSNEAKMAMLNVRNNTLQSYGAVSEQTALEMAQGALQQSRAHIALSVSGIAGPDGGTEQKPVGTVWFALALADGGRYHSKQFFLGDRAAVRQHAVQYALQWLVYYSKLNTNGDSHELQSPTA